MTGNAGIGQAGTGQAGTGQAGIGPAGTGRAGGPGAGRFPVLYVFLLAACFLAPPVAAQDRANDPAAPPPIPPIDAEPRPAPEEDAPIPPKVLDEDAQVEPTVEIRRDEDDNIVEYYKLEGRVYMVKVTPRNGIPYYYMDDDGDGQLELRESDRAAHPVKPVYWKLKEW